MVDAGILLAQLSLAIWSKPMLRTKNGNFDVLICDIKLRMHTIFRSSKFYSYFKTMADYWHIDPIHSLRCLTSHHFGILFFCLIFFFPIFLIKINYILIRKIDNVMLFIVFGLFFFSCFNLLFVIPNILENTCIK
jgi:hypothetical protein